ncbi:MAG: hypothetical protein VW547_01160 [Alphaproteobacteria bacterium]
MTSKLSAFVCHLPECDLRLACNRHRVALSLRDRHRVDPQSFGQFLLRQARSLALLPVFVAAHHPALINWKNTIATAAHAVTITSRAIVRSLIFSLLVALQEIDRIL